MEVVSICSTHADCDNVLNSSCDSSHRAPEVILGLPISEAVDMWGLGCVLAFLYLGNHLFAIDCEYQMVSNHIHLDAPDTCPNPTGDLM